MSKTFFQASTMLGAALFFICISAMAADPPTFFDTSTRQSPQADATDICNFKVGGEKSEGEILFFDRDWSNAEWESSKKRLLEKCGAWKDAKQGSDTIDDLIEAKSQFSRLSMGLWDRMVDATIRKLGPSRDQKNASVCYANAVADAATHHSIKRVSTFSVVVRSFQTMPGLLDIVIGPKNSGGRYSNGGINFVALKGTLAGPLCADDQPVSGLTYSDEDLRQLWVTYEKNYRPYIGTAAPMAIYSQLKNLLEKTSPSLNSSDFISHISRYKNLDTALGESFDRQCNIRVQQGGAIQEVTKFTQVVRAIDAALKSNEVAVVAFKGHALAVTGKLHVGDTNYYLVRIGWGTSCEKISGIHCREGHFWMTETQMKAGANFVSYYGKQLRNN